MVVTTLRKEGAPLVRYRTRDLTRMIPGRCACGSALPRHDRLMGRSDDMFIIRATNIYPGQIADILSRTPGVSSEYNVVLTRAAGKDFMRVLVERDPDAAPAADVAVARASGPHQEGDHGLGRRGVGGVRLVAAIGTEVETGLRQAVATGQGLDAGMIRVVNGDPVSCGSTPNGTCCACCATAWACWAPRKAAAAASAAHAR